MATVNATIKRFGSTWDVIYPKTVVAQITDLTTIGTNLISYANPAANAFIEITTAGAINEISGSTLRTNLDVATIGHTHTTDQINDGNTLTNLLAGKADLSGGKLVASQIPDYLFGGLKYGSTESTAVTLESYTFPANFTTDAEREGVYFVASADIVITFTTDTVTGGDDGDSSFTSGSTLEAGDWMVYLGGDAWGIVNNSYRLGTTAVKGVVKISTTTATTRAGLSSSTSDRGLRVVDEKVLKDAMQGIYYGGSPTGSAGDLWFDGTGWS